MKNIVGQVARKEDFWDRVNEIETIWRAIENGSHVLLVAPRRVGKTSIMYKIHDEPRENYEVVYLDTESADSENEFWHKLFNAIMEEAFQNKASQTLKHWWLKVKTISIKKITTEGVEFGDGKVLNYQEAFYELIRDIDIDKKLIIMMDEFAQTVENIIKNGTQKEAESLLKNHRTLRQNPKIGEKVTFIYAGSIGLESVVAKLNGSKFINDLNPIKVPPLDSKSAKELIQALVKSLGLEINNEITEYLIEKIEWLIPFYIQLILQETNTILKSNMQSKITYEVIDKAFEQALENRNNFEFWSTKLRTAFDVREYKFAKACLNHISERNTITTNQAINKANSLELDSETAKEVLHTLEYDGYIGKQADGKTYRFNSPILKAWWFKNVAN